MNSLGIFAVIYSGVALFFTLGFSIRSRQNHRWLAPVVAGVTLASVTLVAALASPGRNVAVVLALDTLTVKTKAHLCIAAAAGLMGLMASLSMVGLPRAWQRFSCLGAHVAAVGALTLILLKSAFGPEFLSPAETEAQIAASSKFNIEEYASLNMSPTAIALGPDNKIYVAGFTGEAHQRCVVVRLEPTAGTAAAQEVLAANYLTRVQGIAFYGSDLYLSRCGQYSRAVGGYLQRELTGAITRAQDLDGDGTFDYFTDIVANIPGARGYHQNNGICFDSEGTLYVAVGGSSEKEPYTHPWEGTVLRSDWEGKPAEVVARGLRNPYGICVGPDGEIFCTDNDVDVTGKGDDLNHIVEGGHYGHPYTSLDISTEVTGTKDSLLKMSAAPEGLCYVPAGGLPEGLDDSLYVTQTSGQLLRVTLARSGDTYTAESEVVARLPVLTVDVVLGPDGALYVCSFKSNKVYRLTPKQQSKSP